MKSYKLDFNDFVSTEALKAKLDELTRDDQAFNILSGGIVASIINASYYKVLDCFESFGFRYETREGDVYSFYTVIPAGTTYYGL